MLVGRLKRIGISGLTLLASAWLCAANVSAAPTPEQSEKLHAAESALLKGESLYKNGKLNDAAASLQTAQASLAELAEAKELGRQLQPLARRLVNLHDNLAVEGAKVSPLDAAIASLIDPSAEKPMSAKPPGEK